MECSCLPKSPICSCIPCVSQKPSSKADSDAASEWPPRNLYWDGQCTACPAKLYNHCSRGGVLVGERACGITRMWCEGHCTEPLLSGAPQPTLYWDGQCTACPASLYPDSHCALGGTIVDERACGPARAHCEARCRQPQSTPSPQPQLYWDGQCKACPASLYESSHCSQGGSLVGERGCGFLHILCEGHCSQPAPTPEGADWIVIGGGASGCTAAAALADAGEDVLVLERGYSDLDVPDTEWANTWPQVVNTKAAQEIRWTDGTWGAVANVLGGGTQINGGLYIEEEPEFFAESFGQDFNASKFYRSSAWVAEELSEPLQPSSYGRRFAQALHEVGSGSNDPKPSIRMKSNSSWVAYSTFNTTQPTWSRRGAADLLHMRSEMTNLRFYTGYQVMKINFEGERATSVQVENNFKEVVTITARKGIILAAGAVFSPQLLQVSGIGDPALLRSLGVQEVAPNPDVGQNFVDRNMVNFGVWSSESKPLFVGYAMASNTTSQITFETDGWGKVASSFAIASVGLVAPDQRTDLLRKTMTPLFEGPIGKIMDNMIQFVALNHKTYSRGSVTAVSADARTAPTVTANHFKDPRDLEQKFTAMRALKEIIYSDALKDLVNAKSFSGADAIVPVYLSCIKNGPQTDAKAIIVPCLPDDQFSTSREDYIEYFHKAVVSSYHYFGTASFGNVVSGAEFTVKGTSNVHVVDASIFPNPTRVNPQGTIM
ncbi:unnamed protein product, partial [Symbiodinium pilosum]